MAILLQLQKCVFDSSFFFFSFSSFFLADQKIAIFCGIKCVLGHPIAREQVIACCQTYSDYGPPEIPLKLAV